METTKSPTGSAPASVQDELPREPEIAGMTDCGHVRGHNEDQFMVVKLGRSLEVRQTSTPGRAQAPRLEQAWLTMVADGMGGHSAGELASQVAIETMARCAFLDLPWPDRHEDGDDQLRQGEIARAFESAFVASQRRIERASAERRIGDRPGTTMTVAFVAWPFLYVAHAGDSRCYILRRGTFRSLSQDQTIGAELGLDPDNSEAALNHVLYNAIGGDTDIPSVQHSREHLEPGDILLLCTDGITGHLSDRELTTHLEALETGAIPSAEACVQRMIEVANERGGRDNMTAVVARFGYSPESWRYW